MDCPPDHSNHDVRSGSAERTSRFAIGIVLDLEKGQNAAWQVQFRPARRAGMAISTEDRRRAKELVRELFKITGSRFKPDGTSKTFDEIEQRAIEVTDVLASMLIEQAVQEAPDIPHPCRCPECKAALKDRDDGDEPIILQTDRGEVGFLTQGYYCRRCRRSFFPSAG